MSELGSPKSPATRISSLPKTPQAPIIPPRRSSSLAFSHKTTRIIKSPLSQQSLPSPSGRIRQPDFSQPNIGKKRNTIPSCIQDGPPPGHVAQMQRIFQAAKATLHRDMFAASSPASSIQSRMELDQCDPLEIATPRLVKDVECLESGSKEWRYSTAPQILAEMGLDVREPLPSPTLPDLPSHSQPVDDEVAEPVSSGFSSPLHDQCNYPAIDAVTASDTIARDCQDLGSPSPDNVNLNQLDQTLYTELHQPLTNLRVASDGSEIGNDEGLPPIERRLSRHSFGSSMDVGASLSPNRSIYLSETAEAAAESAKAKRRLLKDTFALGKGKESRTEGDLGHTATMNTDPHMPCLAPTLHYAGPMIPCPDPILHEYYLPPIGSSRAPRRQNEFVVYEQDEVTLPSYVVPPGTHRATATGSPMPFTRARSRPVTSQGEYPSQRSSPHPYTSHSLRQPHVQPFSLNGHFPSGWYHARETARTSIRPAYSFSTAASKVMGFDQAPDSRIRDSYKTDTLTALVRPPSRFRKNGLGATVAPRGVGRYYQRPSSSSGQRLHVRPMSRQSFAPDEIRFRSSPPRGPDGQNLYVQHRKRAADDASMMEENYIDDQGCFNAMIGVRQDEEMMEIDEDTKAAVRLSIFGTNTPEALHNARQGIKELSPNVQVVRKSTQQDFTARKKRRPSYWDNDLREIRESPAGRGGVNSPASAQASMRAEFEIASFSKSENGLDENDLVGEVARAGEHLEQRLSTMENHPTLKVQEMEVEDS